MTYDSDVIVVGAGAGGATFAYAAAKAGKSVTLLERGGWYRSDGTVHHEQTMLIDKKPYDQREIDVNGSPKRLYMGGVVGGGTALYGGALLRPAMDDFHPGKSYGVRIPRAIWDWPISYNDLEPYYTRAEQLFRVAGDNSDDFGPLQKPSLGFRHHALPLHPINKQLIAANRMRGLLPFRLPLAIDSHTCLRCNECAGYICPTGARRSSGHLIQDATSQGLALQVQTNVEVEQFSANGKGEANGVWTRESKTGKRRMLRAKKYILAAGAIGSSLLALRSETNPLIGRHYMMHLSPIVVGIFKQGTGGDETFIKQVGFADFYFGTKHYEHKMGVVQSLPVPGPLLIAKMAPYLPHKLRHILRRRMLPLAGIIEDLPVPTNRVLSGPQGQPTVRHRFHSYDLERGKRLSGLMVQILRKAGAVMCIKKRYASDEHVAHQCGTLRFGIDSKHAVLDRDCRMFGRPNVFVVDGSFLPTSLGVGPALTIIANSLRVADIVTREL